MMHILGNRETDVMEEYLLADEYSLIHKAVTSFDTKEKNLVTFSAEYTLVIMNTVVYVSQKIEAQKPDLHVKKKKKNHTGKFCKDQKCRHSQLSLPSILPKPAGKPYQEMPRWQMLVSEFKSCH